MIIANHMANETALDQVWLVVSPHNPFKIAIIWQMIDFRYHLAYLAIDDNPKIE